MEFHQQQRQEQEQASFHPYEIGPPDDAEEEEIRRSRSTSAKIKNRMKKWLSSGSKKKRPLKPKKRRQSVCGYRRRNRHTTFVCSCMRGTTEVRTPFLPPYYPSCHCLLLFIPPEENVGHVFVEERSSVLWGESSMPRMRVRVTQNNIGRLIKVNATLNL